MKAVGVVWREFRIYCSPPAEDAKDPGPRPGARNRADGGMMYRNEVGVTLKILPNPQFPVEQF